MAQAKTKDTMAALLAERDALPFFRKGNRRHRSSWWDVTPTGNFQTDYHTGRRYAETILPLMLRNAGPPSLSWVLHDMFEVVLHRRKGKYRRLDKLSGIEIGFMRGLGDLIMCGIASGVYVGRVAAGKSPKEASLKHAKTAVKLIGLLASNHRERDAAGGPRPRDQRA